MSKMSKRTLIASTMMGAFALTGSAVVSATNLSDLHKEEAKIHAAAAKSQEKINSLFEQSQDLLVEYRGVVDETENLKIYNDYLASLVADQQRGIDFTKANRQHRRYQTRYRSSDVPYDRQP